MIKSKRFYSRYGDIDNVGTQIADFCNQKNITKDDIISCVVKMKDNDFSQQMAILIWEEEESK